MAVVTSVGILKASVEVYADGTRFMKLRKKDYAVLPLSEGEVFDPEKYLSELTRLQKNDCMEAALTLLDASARSSKDMVSLLRRKGFTEGAAEETAAYLRANGLIDDARYAERLAEGQIKKPVGLRNVKMKLKQKGFSEEDIESALSGFDEEQQKSACRAACGKLLRKYASLEYREARNKISQSLARKGFSWDVISAVLPGTDDWDAED